MHVSFLCVVVKPILNLIQTFNIFSCLDHTFPVHFVYLLYMQLPVQCSKQEFSSPLAFKKVQSRQKKLCVLKILFSYRKVSIRKQFFTGFDIKMSPRWLNIFYDSPCQKLFSDLYLSIFEHNLENKQLRKIVGLEFQCHL